MLRWQGWVFVLVVNVLGVRLASWGLQRKKKLECWFACEIRRLVQSCLRGPIPSKSVITCYLHSLGR